PRACVMPPAAGAAPLPATDDLAERNPPPVLLAKRRVKSGSLLHGSGGNGNEGSLGHPEERGSLGAGFGLTECLGSCYTISDGRDGGANDEERRKAPSAQPMKRVGRE